MLIFYPLLLVMNYFTNDLRIVVRVLIHMMYLSFRKWCCSYERVREFSQMGRDREGGTEFSQMLLQLMVVRPKK